MASRRLEDLLSEVSELAGAHRVRCLEKGVELLIYCTLREAEEQGQLFGQGRSREQLQAKKEALRTRGYPELAKLVGSPREGKKLTNAGPGESYHQYGRAYDCVPIVGGKPVWSTSGPGAELWEKIGRAGEHVGLEWAGRWKTFREFPHFQLTGGTNIDGLMTERYAAGGTRGIPPSLREAAAGPSEGDALRQLLADPGVHVFVVASVPPATDAALALVEAKAQKVTQLNPTQYFVLRVRTPAALAPDLRNLLWSGPPAAPIVTLGEGEGLNRTATRYALNDVDTITEILHAFTHA